MRLKTNFKTILLCLWILLATPEALATASSANDDIIHTTAFGRLEDVKRLLELGANPNATNVNNTPLLSIAVDRDDGLSIPIMQLLIEKGANINGDKKNIDKSPIFTAIESQNCPALKILLDNDVDYSQINSSGLTPLQFSEIRELSECKSHILNKINQQKKEYELLHSKENLQKQTILLAYNSCAAKFYDILTESAAEGRKDSISDLSKLSYKKAQKAATNLKTIFNVSDSQINAIVNKTTSELNNHIAWLGDRRNSPDFGSSQEIKITCNMIAERWKSNK